MAVALDAALGTGNSASGLSCNLVTTSAVAAGATIILIAGKFSGSGSTVSASGGGLTWTQDQTNTSGSLRVSIFRALAAAGLASGTTLTVTAASGANDFVIGAGSFTGIDTVSPVRTSGGASASSTAWSTGSIAASSGDFLIGGTFEDGSATATSTPTGPAVELLDRLIAGQSEALTAAYKLSVAGSDSIAGTWSTSVGHVVSGVAYKAAAGGGTVVKHLAALGVG